MADKPRFLDVWIVQSNTVYREVPYAVVTDWIQQGRLLEEDKARPSGTNEWFLLGRMPSFAPFLPKADPQRADDQAEALEPVELDVGWKHSPRDTDQDVDMIPLIDVSLVLLIFFMMTSAVGGAGDLINLPIAEHKLVTETEGLWVGIDRVKGEAVYSIGSGDKPAAADDDKIKTQQELLNRLDQRLPGHLYDVRIRADRQLPYEVVKNMTIALEERRPKGPQAKEGVNRIYAEVSVKEGS